MKKQKVKNILLTIGLTMSLLPSIALANKEVGKNENTNVANSVINDSYQIRKKLIAHFGESSGLVIGMFPGSAISSDPTLVLKRFLPFANFLSLASNQLISFVPDSNIPNWKQEVKNKRYNLIYVNAEIAVEAAKYGYEPLVKRAEPITSVLVTKKSNTKKELIEWDNQKIGVIKAAMVTTLARGDFNKNNVKPNYIDISSAGNEVVQEDLLYQLDNNLTEGIILRKETIEAVIKKLESEKKEVPYKISKELSSAPGFIIMARDDVSIQVKESITKNILTLSPEVPNAKAILIGLNNKDSIFEEATLKDIEKFKENIDWASK